MSNAEIQDFNLKALARAEIAAAQTWVSHLPVSMRLGLRHHMRNHRQRKPGPAKKRIHHRFMYHMHKDAASYHLGRMSYHGDKKGHPLVEHHKELYRHHDRLADRHKNRITRPGRYKAK